jgi:hypothetical protein
MTDSFDSELFIESVNKFREILDTQYELYHYKNAKRAAWMKICGIFEPSFEEKSPKIKEVSQVQLIKNHKNVLVQENVIFKHQI